MSVRVEIVDGPVDVRGGVGRGGDGARGDAGMGAAVVFEGIVRGEEAGRNIQALHYDVYRPMAERVLRELGEAAMARHGVKRVAVWHSAGRVPVGCASFRLEIESSHRREALAAMADFIDAMKKDAPIWKTAVYTDTEEVSRR